MVAASATMPISAVAAMADKNRKSQVSTGVVLLL
jgi:hypothetical protein